MVDIKLMSSGEIATELGGRLRSRRLSMQMTQKEVAERAGINVGTVKNLETRTAACTLDTLIRTVRVLGFADQFAVLFAGKAQSIAQMEQSASAPRLRARRSLRQ
jgi:transcriptional regulator with XRE-family HTH domain